jgi:hypothetical protein
LTSTTTVTQGAAATVALAERSAATLNPALEGSVIGVIITAFRIALSILVFAMTFFFFLLILGVIILWLIFQVRYTYLI